MDRIKKVSNVLHSRPCSYLYFIFSVCAYIFLNGASWAYGWIAEIYPLGDNFIPVLFGIISACIAITFAYLLFTAFAEKKKKDIKGLIFINIIHTIFALLGIITFIYTFVLVFGLDSGISADKFINGLKSISSDLIYLTLALGIGLPLIFCESRKKNIAGLYFRNRYFFLGIFHVTFCCNI